MSEIDRILSPTHYAEGATPPPPSPPPPRQTEPTTLLSTAQSVGDFGVAPTELTRLAGEVAAILNALRTDGRAALEPTREAPAGIDGWRTGERLGHIAEVWDGQLLSLQMLLAESEGWLHETARNYTGAETHNSSVYGG